MKLLRLLRAISGLTQADVAESMGVTQGAVSGWETGKFEPSIADLKSLSITLNCSISDLLAENEADLSDETKSKYSSSLREVKDALIGEVS